MEDTNNKYNFLDYAGLSLFWNNVKNIIEDNELVTATALTNLDTRVDSIKDALKDALSNQIISITYTDLKTLRDNGDLVPGQQYRITDYTCTTTQANTKSAGHVFDIIVTADDENTLNEVARALKHDGDTYFANCDLNAWKIWYSLDNDTTRFAWADETNGKGVIYRMIDEWNNDVPYDFKNIQFKHPKDTTTYPYYYYTFASSNIEDNTDNSLSILNNCYSNTINGYTSAGKMILNNIIFIGGNCYKNSFGSGCYFNAFDDGCNSNSFGNSCGSNTFGNSCGSNTFGNNCGRNAFGNNCWNNAFGNNCWSNAFGNDCDSNTFGNNCYDIKFASDSFASAKHNYYECNHFGDGCAYIVFKNAYTSSPNTNVQNYNFAQGLQGTSSAYLTIDGVRNRSFETKVAKKSNGELKIYCEADLIL